MIEPVPLERRDKHIDIDLSVKEIFNDDPDDFEDLGYTQFFYTQKDSNLPIRDVMNTHNKGFKTEPFIEMKAENFCSKCYQTNINSFTKKLDRRYLFLITNTRDSVVEDEFGRKRWIVGYIEKQRGLALNGRTAVQGPIKLVSFEDAVGLDEINADTGFRSNKKLDEDQTNKLIDKLEDAENIYDQCLEEVKRMEKKISREKPWEPYYDDKEIVQSEGC